MFRENLQLVNFANLSFGLITRTIRLFYSSYLLYSCSAVLLYLLLLSVVHQRHLLWHSLAKTWFDRGIRYGTFNAAFIRKNTIRSRNEVLRRVYKSAINYECAINYYRSIIIIAVPLVSAARMNWCFIILIISFDYRKWFFGVFGIKS